MSMNESFSFHTGTNGWMTYGTPSNFVVLSIVILIVCDRGIAQHCHHIGEYDARSLVFVGVDEHPEAFELVRRTKNRSLGASLLGEPNGHAVAVEVALTVDLELDFNLQPL